MTHTDYALLCKAMGDETRLKIVDMLRHGSLCACKILEAFNCTQPTLSYHMKMLCDSGLVSGEKDGKWIHYSLKRAVLYELVGFLSSPCDVKDDCSCRE